MIAQNQKPTYAGCMNNFAPPSAVDRMFPSGALNARDKKKLFALNVA
jgi:hypothetical protein